MGTSRLLPLFLVVLSANLKGCLGGRGNLRLLDLDDILEGHNHNPTQDVGGRNYPDSESMHYMSMPHSPTYWKYSNYHSPPVFPHHNNARYYYHESWSGGTKGDTSNKNSASLLTIGSNTNSQRDKTENRPQITEEYIFEEGPGPKKSKHEDRDSDYSSSDSDESEEATTPPPKTARHRSGRKQKKIASTTTTAPPAPGPNSNSPEEEQQSLPAQTPAQPVPNGGIASKKHGYAYVRPKK